MTAENPVDLEGNARLFMELAQHAGAQISSAAADAFLQTAPPPGPPELRLDAPGIAQARLVERFGAPDTHADALRAARVEDVLGRRRDTLYAHFRWTVSDSLYHAGFVAWIVGWLADHPNVLARLQPPGLRDYVITRSQRAAAAQRRVGRTGPVRRLGDLRPEPRRRHPLPDRPSPGSGSTL